MGLWSAASDPFDDPIIGIRRSSRYGSTAGSVVTMYVPKKARTLSPSTIRRAMARARWGSPPSSAKITLTGWPARPPRALTSAAQARTATGIGATSAPSGPAPTPNDPSTMGDPARASGTGAAGAPALRPAAVAPWSAGAAVAVAGAADEVPALGPAEAV